MKYENPIIKNEINKITQTNRKQETQKKNRKTHFFNSYVIISIHDGFNRRDKNVSCEFFMECKLVLVYHIFLLWNLYYIFLHIRF